MDEVLQAIATEDFGTKELLDAIEEAEEAGLGEKAERNIDKRTEVGYGPVSLSPRWLDEKVPSLRDRDAQNRYAKHSGGRVDARTYSPPRVREVRRVWERRQGEVPLGTI